jgi:hypothetical protein
MRVSIIRNQKCASDDPLSHQAVHHCAPLAEIMMMRKSQQNVKQSHNSLTPCASAFHRQRDREKEDLAAMSKKTLPRAADAFEVGR